MKYSLIFYFLFNLNFSKCIKKQNDRYIYHSNEFPWYIFYDSNNTNCDIVEIGGVKYGVIDRLEKINLNDTISKSKNGILYYQNKKLIYYSYELKKKFKLKKTKYTSSFKEKRYKIFNTYAHFIIRNFNLSEEEKTKIYDKATKDFIILEKGQLDCSHSFMFEEAIKR